jgi:hypothetical protein
MRNLHMRTGNYDVSCNLELFLCEAEKSLLVYVEQDFCLLLNKQELRMEKLHLGGLELTNLTRKLSN